MRLFTILIFTITSAAAQTEREYQEAICTGMGIEVQAGGGTRIDCLSDSHAIEVDFSDKWAEGLGQAMLYAARTGLTPGVILICRRSAWACQRHGKRLIEAAAYWQIPLAVWQCPANVTRLSDCSYE